MSPNRPNAPSHYIVPGTEIELIDVIKANLSLGEYQAFLWASLMQYAYRWHKKGEPENDLRKMLTYGNWLAAHVQSNGQCMGMKKDLTSDEFSDIIPGIC